MLAGCFDDATLAVRLDGVPLATAVAGGSYLFHHDGGKLTVAVADNGSQPARAHVDLFGPTARLAGWPLGPAGERPASAAISLPAGDYVLHVRSVENGTLALHGGGGTVPAVRALASHVERIILHQTPHEGLGVPQELRLTPQSLNIDVTFELERPPTSMTIYATDAAEQLHVSVAGDLGILLDLANGYVAPPPALFFDERRMTDLGGRFWPENVVGTSYTATLHANHVDGAVVLESRSFSLAAPAAAPSAARVPEMAFLYGELEHLTPTAIQVSGSPNTIILSQFPVDLPEDWAYDADMHGEQALPAESVVTLYAPDDRRIGTYAIGSEPVAVTLNEPGSYVLVLLSGQTFVGLSSVPSDFQMHALRNGTVTAPATPAGSNGDFGVRRDQVDLQGGIAYHVSPRIVAASGPPVFIYGSCWDAAVRVVQDNQTVGFAELRTSQLRDEGMEGASTRLATAPIEVVSEGFGQGSPCTVALDFQVYHRS